MFNSHSRKPPREKYQGSGQITAIEPQKTDVTRMNIFIEGEYAFGVADIVMAEHGLRVGLILDKSTVAELQESDLYQRGMASALNLLARRAHSESEIRTRLKRNFPEISASMVERIISRLKELNYLNDAEFARIWVQNRANFSPRGRLLIKQELTAKGIEKEQIEEVVTEVLKAPAEDDEEGRTLEEKQALDQARKKAHSLAGEDWPGYYRKMGGFLMRRGYDYSIVKNVVRDSWKELKDESPGEDLEE
jgi:regulatory protein